MPSKQSVTFLPLKLAQHLGKLAQQILWFFELIELIFSIEAIILAQDLPLFCEIL